MPLNPMPRRCTARLLAGLVALLAAGAPAQSVESWRFTHSMDWSGPEPQPPPDRARLTGRTLGFAPDALLGAAPFACAPGRWQTVDAPVEGLFEGGLPAPLVPSAQKLGIALADAQSTATLRRIFCPNAGFDFVQVDAETLLVALDNRIWSLSNTPGTRAPPGSPEAAVQALLETHFGADRGFLPPLLAPKLRWLSAPLRRALQTYFARPRANEVPPINEDAFTSAQEAPTRFAVGAARVAGPRAELWVRFGGEAFGGQAHEWRLKYLLVREAAGWRLDDIRLDEQDARGLRKILESD